MRQLLIVPCGGLANRMRAIVCGLSLAADASMEPIILWWPYSGLNAPFYSLFERSTPIEPLLHPINTAQFYLKYKIPCTGNLYISRLWQNRQLDHATFDDTHSDIFYAHPEQLLQMALNSSRMLISSGLEFYHMPTELYRSIFRPSPQVAQRLEQLTERFVDGETFGVHIRRTDNATAISLSPLDGFVQLMEQTLASRPNARFFLATDDSEVKQALSTRFGHNHIICNPAPASRRSELGMIDAFAEMLALSRTCRIFGSQFSTFSTAAATLGQIPLSL